MVYYVQKGRHAAEYTDRNGKPIKIKVGCMYMKVKLNLYICRMCAEHAT